MVEETPIRILNVDDNEAKRYTVTRLLQSAGYVVDEAGTGTEALRLATRKPALIILDVNLPDMSGFEVAQRIKADNFLADIHILHLSGTSVELADRVQGLNLGADAYLTEPVENIELLATVNSLVRASKVEALNRQLLEREQQARAEAEARAADLRRANEELVGLKRELERVNAELQAADARKDEFLAMLGHELRNPLAAVRNSLHLLTRSDTPDAAAARHKAVIERQVLHMVRMVDDLLDVARFRQGRVDLRREHVDLVEVTRHAADSYRSLLNEAGLEFVVRYSEVPLPVHGDPTRLQQVIVNVLANAAKYTPAGGQVELTVESESTYGVIRVRDTGVGIPPELLSRVFDLFIQEDRSLARSRGGLGIGLTLVRRLVEQHGGRVAARSEGVGHGSIFEISIPLEVERAQPRVLDGQSPEKDATPGRSLVLVVIEDNVDSADTLAEVLQAWGHRTFVARNGRDGLSLIRSKSPDVVLLDIGLPLMDGYEVAREARSGGFTGALLALSGYNQLKDVERTANCGFDYHLVKPVDPASLQRMLLTISAGEGGSAGRRRA